MGITVAPDSWALMDEAWSTALGLPPRPHGWGLVMFEDGGRRWTWAGDPVIVAALEYREGDLPNWDPDFPLEADGWPERVPSPSGPHSMTWRTRTVADSADQHLPAPRPWAIRGAIASTVNSSDPPSEKGAQPMTEQPKPGDIRQELTELRRHAAKRRKVAANHRSRADLGRRVSLAHTADETVQRARAAAERERAAQARQDTRTSGDQPPDERDRLADQRDAAADERDQIADQRETTLDERDKIANARERTANERDLYADHRDRVADQRDLAADQRDRQTLKDRSN